MSNETQPTKTHYRKVFKSEHLGVADLEDLTEQGHNLIFTIHHVNQEFDARVAGKIINGNIAYFVEDIKPLVLNATNSKIVKKLTGSSFVEDWSNVMVQLFIDYNVSMMKQIVGGVRIHPNPVKLQRMIITPQDTKTWNRVINAFKRDGNFDKVLAHADMSKEHQEMIIRGVQNAV